MAAKSTRSKLQTKLIKKIKPIKKKLAKKKDPKLIGLVVILAIFGLLYLFRSFFFVAFVGGVPITRAEFTKELEKAIGQETLDNLITKKLIFQEAKRKDVTVPDTEIDEEITKITELVKSQGTTLDLALASQGQTIESLRDNIQIQKTVEKILEDKVLVSDEEILTYFNDNSEFYGENVNFEELKESIREQLLQEKLSSEFSSLLENLKANSSIINFTDY